MCLHESFRILFSNWKVTIRQCEQCNKIEVKVEDWVDFDTLKEALEEVEQEIKEEED